MGRAVVFGLFAGVLLFAEQPSAAEQQAPAVRVLLHDSASIAEGTLSEAREFSVGVFRAAGVEADMVSDALACPASAPRFCVMVLLRPRHPQFEPGKLRTMGVALAADQDRGVVSVYFDAVLDVARRYGQPVGKILGIALAHEIGHVLLPPPSHSAAGIMQPAWEGDALRHAVDGDIAFTGQQAALIRDRLMRHRMAQ